MVRSPGHCPFDVARASAALLLPRAPSRQTDRGTAAMLPSPPRRCKASKVGRRAKSSVKRRLSDKLNVAAPPNGPFYRCSERGLTDPELREKRTRAAERRPGVTEEAVENSVQFRRSRRTVTT